MEACSGRKIGDDVIYEIRLDEIGLPDSHHRFGGESIVFPFSIGAYWGNKEEFNERVRHDNRQTEDGE